MTLDALERSAEAIITLLISRRVLSLFPISTRSTGRTERVIHPPIDTAGREQRKKELEGRRWLSCSSTHAPP